MEGLELGSTLEKAVTDILEEEKSADEMVAAFVKGEELETAYDASHDEMENYPGTKCLVNYFNIKDRERLRTVENNLVAMRTAELFVHPLTGHLTMNYLKGIHNRLFGDVYPSAGLIRTSEASKRKDFCHPSYIEEYSKKIFDGLSRQNWLKNIEDPSDFANELAFYMGEAEALHPFRDGNGRAIRFFFNTLAYEAGYLIHWVEADADRMLEAGIAAIDGDYQALVDCLEEILEKI